MQRLFYAGMLAFLFSLTSLGSASAAAQTRMRASLQADRTAGDISGSAKYQERANGRRRFSIEVEGFVPGTQLDVLVDGIVIGTITIDNIGVGELEFDTNLEAGDTELPFPGNFPSIERGDRVQVGQLRGRFKRQQ
jgi:hypothetical protein